MFHGGFNQVQITPASVRFFIDCTEHEAAAIAWQISLKFYALIDDRARMNKFFSKELADKIGYGVAIQLSAIAADFQSELNRMAATSKAHGFPTFEHDEAADEAEFRRMMAEGHRFDLDVEEWVLKEC